MTDLELAQRYVAKAQNAKDRNIEFNISLKHYKKLLQQKRCAYTNQPLDDNYIKGVTNPNYRTIDRIDASKGYTDENTVACTFSFNIMKNNLTIKALFQILNVVNKLK